MLYGGCFTRIKHDERERMTMLEFCELPKRKKERKKHTNKTKKWNEIKTKSRKKEEIFSFFFFFFFGMKRISRTWQSYEKDSTLECSFCACTRLSCSSLPRGISTWPKKRFGRLSSPEFSISFLFFFSLSFNRAYSKIYPRRCMSRVARPRPDLCGVAYAWEREGVNIIINNVI